MEHINWNMIESFLKKTILLVSSKLDQKSIEAVNHYVNHAEYEMAFEGLFIEIMKMNEVPDIDFSKSKEIGLLLKLDKESVFDVGFWKKFKNYVDAKEQA